MMSVVEAITRKPDGTDKPWGQECVSSFGKSWNGKFRTFCGEEIAEVLPKKHSKSKKNGYWPWLEVTR